MARLHMQKTLDPRLLMSRMTEGERERMTEGEKARMTGKGVRNDDSVPGLVLASLSHMD